MLIDRKKEAALHELTNAWIGLQGASEQWVRWQLARLLIRWNALVIRGEDDMSPAAIKAREGLRRIFARLNSLHAN